jgi:hypothetical protein
VRSFGWSEINDTFALGIFVRVSAACDGAGAFGARSVDQSALCRDITFGQRGSA